jgi:hypothetical protein
MLHAVLIGLHAAAGVVCFAAGLLCIPLRAPGSWRFRVYAGSLVAMLGFVIGSIAYSWVGLDVATRLIFTGLVGLGLYMVWRSGSAYVKLSRQLFIRRPRRRCERRGFRCWTRVNVHLADDMHKIVPNKPLSPVLLVRGSPRARRDTAPRTLAAASRSQSCESVGWAAPPTPSAQQTRAGPEANANLWRTDKSDRTSDRHVPKRNDQPSAGRCATGNCRVATRRRWIRSALRRRAGGYETGWFRGWITRRPGQDVDAQRRAGQDPPPVYPFEPRF